MNLLLKGFVVGLAILLGIYSFESSAQTEKADQFIILEPIADKACTDSVFKIEATASSGLPLTIAIVSGSAIIRNDSIFLTNIDFTGGKVQTSVLVKVSQAGNAQYNPASDEFASFTIKTNFWAELGNRPLFTVVDTSAFVGDTLRVDVTSVAGISYNWLTPNQNTISQPLLYFPNATTILSGIYSLNISEGKCKLYQTALKLSVLTKPQPPDTVISPPDTLIPRPDSTLKIYTVITPNDDQKNDTFYIENIEKHMRNELTIVDSWGNTLFQAINYDNSWSPKDEQTGEYFYSLLLKSTGKRLAGSFLILR